MEVLVLGLMLCGTLVAGPAAGQANRIDVVTPSAPELATFGPHAIGVRTLRVTDRNRPDILSTKPGGPTARYDRTLTIEVWYPATLVPSQAPAGEYKAITRDPSITATLHGRAVRDAAPLATAGPFPLIIVSHGYPGNRYLMSHLGENLSSKGFVVVSIDHPDSTYDDQKGFSSTLYNRPFDQLFALNEMERFGRQGSGSFLSGLVDASRTGLVGYSMGGYGVVNVVGGGYSVAQRDGIGRSTEPAARGAWRLEPCVSEEPRRSHQSSDRDWPVGDAGWFLGRRRARRHPDSGPVRCRQPGRCGWVREGGQGHLPGCGQRGPLSPDLRQRQPQRRRADAGADRDLRRCRDASLGGVCTLRRCRLGHDAHEQHPPTLCDGLLFFPSQGRGRSSGCTSTDPGRASSPGPPSG